jgi:glycosyltransferase involved in cell wall biosynthesis
MRLAFVNPTGQLGGAELSLLDLLASLRAAAPGAELHLLATADGPLIERAGALGVSCRVVPLPESVAGLGDSALRGRGKLGAALTLARRGMPAAWATRRYAGELRRGLEAIRPDLIHSNGIKAHLLLRLAAPPGVPVVWHVRDFLGSRPLMARALGWASRRACGGIAISKAVGQDAGVVLPRLPVRVVYNAIDVERFSPGPGDGPSLDGQAGLAPPPECTARVGMVATYARWKGQDLFLKAIAALPRDLAARFYIIGGPIYQTKGSQYSVGELRDLAGSLGVSERVAFVPFQGDTASVYRALDVVVHASTLPEPFGRTIIEAMACGRPVCVPRAGGAAELFREGEDAVGFAPGDPEALAEAILGLIRNPARRATIGEAARASARARFSRERLGPEVLAAYRAFGAQAD